MTHRIAVENQQEAVTLPRGSKTLLRRAVTLALATGGFEDKAEVSVTLVEAEEMRRLNRETRQVDRETDVLSFPLLVDAFHPEPDDVLHGAVMLGDIVVCPAVLTGQAEEFGVSFREEMCRMVIHSALHLLGWDHMVEKEKEKMFALQEKVLRDLALEQEW